MIEFLPVLIAISAVLAIYGNFKNRRLHFITKPLTTILIMVFAFTEQSWLNEGYANLILGGLLLSLAGDIFLMLEEKFFLAGLGSFLIAHIFYIFAFTQDTGMTATPLIYLPLIVFAGISGGIIGANAGKLSLPVYLYIFIISFMLWRGWELYHFFGSDNALYAASGATLFMISDFFLGYDKFRKTIPMARLYILGTYFLAQFLIAYSI